MFSYELLKQLIKFIYYFYNCLYSFVFNLNPNKNLTYFIIKNFFFLKIYYIFVHNNRLYYL